MRRWATRLALALAVAILAVVAVPLGSILPLVRDDQVLDRVVVAVVLDWRDFGVDRARERLQYELDARGIGGQVSEGDCSLLAEEEGGRTVACRWEVLVELPFVEQPWPLAFESVARVDRRGVLLR